MTAVADMPEGSPPRGSPPHSVAAGCPFGGGVPLPLPLTDEERAILVPPPALSVIEWADQRRVLDAKTSAISGPWSWEIVPFMLEPAEAWCDPAVRRLTGKKCTQSSWTELLLNILGRTIDEAPAPTMMVMPVAKDIRRRIRTRVEPMFRECPTLLEHLGGEIRNLNVGEETSLDNMLLYLGWSTSPAALSDNPVCYVLLDEVDKYPDRLGREADPISLAEKRQRTFPNAKTITGSTPTDETGPIEREFNAGDRREYWCPCPHCGTYQVLSWRQGVELDKTDSGELLGAGEYEAGGHARYRCAKCKRPWTEAQRWEAVTNGVWCPDGCTVGRDGRISGKRPRGYHRSYHITALMLHPAFQTIDGLAAAWAKANVAKRGGDFGPLIDFVNSQLAEVWTETVAVTEPDRLAAHVEEYAEDEVPTEAVVLTAGIDVQLDHFYIVVAAWAYLYECWLVRAQRLDVAGTTDDLRNWRPLAEALAMSFPRASDAKELLPIRLAMIDSGYRTYECYHFCRTTAAGAVLPTKGFETLPTYLKPSKIDYSPRTGRIARGSIVLWNVNTTAYKDRLANLAANAVPGPGYLHLPAGTTDDFMAQFTAEHKRVIRKGRGKAVHVWVPKETGADNHYWDAFVLALAAADMARVRNIPPPDAPAASRPRRRITQMTRFADR